MSNVCREISVKASIKVKLAAVRVLAQRRALPNFGNAAAVKELLDSAKGRAERRMPKAERTQLELVDVDERGGSSREHALRFLHDSPAHALVKELENSLAVRQAEGGSLDSLVGHLVFTGNSGTGKVSY